MYSQEPKDTEDSYTKNQKPRTKRDVQNTEKTT